MEHGRIRDDLRERVSLALLRAADSVAQDALAAFTQLTSDDRDREYPRRLLDQLLRLLAYAIDGPGLAGRAGELAQLSCTLDEKRFPERELFSLVLSLERSALDELAVDDNMGATSDVWGTVAQLIRAASFELLAAHAEGSRAATAGMTDPLTGARSHAFFDVVLAVECDRARRFGDRLALIAVRLDDSAIADERLGTGVAEKMLRRIGIVARRFFRQQDLVARLAGDAIAVLLVRSDAEHAEELAERLRATVEQRLETADHRTGERFRVTVSAAVVHSGGAPGMMVDPERLHVELDRALDRAQARGGNRVETVRSTPSRTPPRNLPSA
jgi:diguanylate cyclase (GGDEF)-like protein